MDKHILLDRCCVEFVVFLLLFFELQLFSTRNQKVTFYMIHFIFAILILDCVFFHYKHNKKKLCLIYARMLCILVCIVIYI